MMLEKKSCSLIHKTSKSEILLVQDNFLLPHFYRTVDLIQGSQKGLPVVREVDFPVGQVIFSAYLSKGQGPGKPFSD